MRRQWNDFEPGLIQVTQWYPIFETKINPAAHMTELIYNTHHEPTLLSATRLAHSLCNSENHLSRQTHRREDAKKGRRREDNAAAYQFLILFTASWDHSHVLV